MALWDESHVPSFSSSERHFGVVLKMACSSRVWGLSSIFGVLTIFDQRPVPNTPMFDSPMEYSEWTSIMEIYQHHPLLKDNKRERVSFKMASGHTRMSVAQRSKWIKSYSLKVELYILMRMNTLPIWKVNVFDQIALI